MAPYIYTNMPDIFLSMKTDGLWLRRVTWGGRWVNIGIYSTANIPCANVNLAVISKSYSHTVPMSSTATADSGPGSHGRPSRRLCYPAAVLALVPVRA